MDRAARKLAQVILVAAGLVTARAAEAQFPIIESFQNSTAPGWLLRGSAALTGNGLVDQTGQGWLRLTDPNQYEAGSAIYDTAFSSSTGMVVTFTYATYGGDGADGLSFYLINGSPPSPTVGAYGGSLGYSLQYWSGCSGAFYAPGVTNGYVGIGFDEYGDFSDCPFGSGGPGQTPNAVAIRGSGSLFTGFQYLTGTQISNPPFSQGVATGSRAAARPVRISIVKKMLRVEVDFGSGYQTVVGPYDLSTAPGQAALPATLKMGFSGSTGYFTNYHEIRNVTVTKPATLTLTHAAAPATVSVGGTVTYTATVSNDDTNGVSGISFSDMVPAGITGVTWTAATAGGATVSSASGSGNAIGTTLNLPINSSVTFTVTGTASASAAGTTLTHAATITPPASVSNLSNDSATASVVVRPMTSAVTVASSANPSVPGAPVTFTATVSAMAPGSGTPTGSVTFKDGTTTLGTSPLTAGLATLTSSSLPAGTCTITAVYGGDSAFLGATSGTLSQVVGACVPVLQLPDAGQTLIVPLEPGGTWVMVRANVTQPCGGTPALSWLVDRMPAGAVETAQGNEYSVFIPEQAYPSILANADLGASMTAQATGPSGLATATLNLLFDPSALLHVEQTTDRAALAPGDLALLTTIIRSNVSVTLPQIRLDDLLDGLDLAGPPEVDGAAVLALETSAGKANVTLDAVAGGGAPVTVRLPVRLTAARGGLSRAQAVAPPSGAMLSPQVAAQTDWAVPPGCGCTHGGGVPVWPLLVVLLCAGLRASGRPARDRSRAPFRQTRSSASMRRAP